MSAFSSSQCSPGLIRAKPFEWVQVPPAREKTGRARAFFARCRVCLWSVCVLYMNGIFTIDVDIDIIMFVCRLLVRCLWLGLSSLLRCVWQLFSLLCKPAVHIMWLLRLLYSHLYHRMNRCWTHSIVSAQIISFSSSAGRLKRVIPA